MIGLYYYTVTYAICSVIYDVISRHHQALTIIEMQR